MISLTEVIKVSGMVFGVVGIILSLGLIFFPEQILKLNNALNKKISTDKLQALLEKEFDITNIIMQVRVLTGLITLLLSFILLILIVRL